MPTGFSPPGAKAVRNVAEDRTAKPEVVLVCAKQDDPEVREKIILILRRMMVTPPDPMATPLLDDQPHSGRQQRSRARHMQPKDRNR
jgi:hypothetical protein